MLKATKFGGSSVAGADQFRKIKAIRIVSLLLLFRTEVLFPVQRSCSSFLHLLNPRTERKMSI